MHYLLGPGEYNPDKADRAVRTRSPEHRIGTKLKERPPDSIHYPGGYKTNQFCAGFILAGFKGDYEI